MTLDELETPPRPRRNRGQAREWSGFSTEIEPSVLELDGDLDTTILPPAPRGERNGVKYTDMRTGKLAKTRYDKLRGKREAIRNDEVFDDLINVILNAKKDITRINGLDDIENARKYAKARGYREPVLHDLNDDGVDDVVIPDKKGYPLIVNGYKLSNSRQPIRKMYIDAKRRGEANDYKHFVRNLYGADEVFDDNGERNVRFSNSNLPESLARLKDHGWRVPTAPRSKLSIYQRIMRLIQANYRAFVDTMLSGNDKEYINGILPRFKLFSIVYMTAIDAIVWQQMPDNLKNQIRARVAELNDDDKYGEDGMVTIYDGFKAWKESNKKFYNQYLTNNFNNIRSVDLGQYLGQALTGCGFTHETLADDSRFPRESDVRAAMINAKVDHVAAEFTSSHKANMKTLKSQWSSAADRYKEQRAEQLFV